MRGFWRHWAISAFALAVTAWVLPGVHVEGILSLLIAAIILGFLNAVVKPIFEFPGGCRFEFTDPDGNVLAVWSDQPI